MDTLITQASDIPRIATKLAETKLWSVDTETTGLSPLDSKLRLLQICDGKDIYVIDLFKTGRPDPLLRLMQSRICILHNAKFDAKFLLHEYGFEFGRIFDPFCASNLLYNGELKGQNLYDVLKRELDIDPPTEDLGRTDWGGEISREQIEYAAGDVAHLIPLREVLLAKLQAKGLMQVMGIEMGAIVPVAAMELSGMPVDTGMWLSLAEDNAIRKKACESDLMAVLPDVDNQLDMFGSRTLNLDSPVQLLQSLRKYGLPVTSTAELELSQLDDPIIDKVLRYREYSQCIKSFGTDYLGNVSPVTGRIHSSYYPFTGAGRYSCSKPNLQQIPNKEAFRSCFRPKDGNVFVICDYSQIELRIAAEITGDARLINVYARDGDVHTTTASLVSGVPEADVTKDMRKKAKPVNFGLVYGMSAEKLSRYSRAQYGVTMPIHEAELFHQRYFHAYAGIKRWHREMLSDANRRVGESRTIAGRYRKLGPDEYNAFLNTPIQGTGSDGMKAALAVVHKRIQGVAKLVNCVHDELVCETSADNAEEVGKMLSESMVAGMQPMLKRVPVVADSCIGESWGAK